MPSNLMFSGSGNFVKHWNNVVTIFALYNSFMIPLQIFYGDQGHSQINGNVVSCIDACVDLFFLIDVIIRFRTTYLDTKLSFEVRDPHKIATHYLKGSFTLDFISSVPFSSLIPANEGGQAILDALGLLKLLRLSRLYTTVARANLSQDVKVYLKVVMMAIFLLVFVHVLSCFWFKITSIHERWVQNMDFMYWNQE